MDEEDEGEEAQDLDAPMINWDVDFEIQNTSKILEKPNQKIRLNINVPQKSRNQLGEMHKSLSCFTG